MQNLFNSKKNSFVKLNSHFSIPQLQFLKKKLQENNTNDDLMHAEKGIDIILDVLRNTK